MSRVWHHRGGTENHQDGVPDDATASLGYLNHARKVVVEKGADLSGLKPLGQSGEAAQVGHQQGNLALLSPKFETFGYVEEYPFSRSGLASLPGFDTCIFKFFQLLLGGFLFGS